MHDKHYSMPAELIILLADQKLSLNARRLVHGLFHAVGMRLPDKKLWGVAAMNACRIRLTTLRQTIGPRGAKDNRVYQAAIEELADNGTLFRQLEQIANARGVLCQFSAQVVNCTRGTKMAFARFDLDDVADCRSAKELCFLENALLHRNKDRPLFLLPGFEGKAYDVRWPKVRDPWLRAASKVAARTGDRFLFALVADDWEVGKVTIKVKISHDATKWDPGKLYSGGASTQLIEVCATGHRYLDRETVVARRRCTKVLSLAD